MKRKGKPEKKIKSLDATTLPSLPDGWCWVTLHDLASQEPHSITDGPFGSNLKTAHYTETGPRVIRLQNIGDGNFFDEYAHISESHFRQLKRHEIRAGDLAIAALGESLPRSCVMPSWVGPAIVKADCPRFRANLKLALPEYVNYGLNSPETRRRTSAIIHGVGRPRLNLSEIRGIWLPLAPPNEQRRIVAKIEELFSDLDAGVAALERAKANLKRYRASVLKAAVEGKLTEEWRVEHPNTEPASKLLERILAERRQKWEADQLAKFAAASKEPQKNWRAKYVDPTPPDTNDLPALPEGWCWATVEQSVKIIDYRGRTPPYSDNGIPHLRSQNVKDGMVVWDGLAFVSPATFDQYMTRGLPQEGDLLFTTEAPLGQVCMAPAGTKFSIAQRVILVRPSDGFLDHVFLMYQFMGIEFQEALGLRQTGSTVRGVSSRNFRPATIRVPPIAEQRRIAAEIEERLSVNMESLSVINTSLLRAASLRQSILKQAFEGKLVPQDSMNEPASVLLELIKTMSPLRPAVENGENGGSRLRGKTMNRRKVADASPKSE